MTEKPRWPLSDALAVAEEIRDALAPACERIEIAGSIRRRKPDVGDVEIVFVPRFEPEAPPPGMLPGMPFAAAARNLTDVLLTVLLVDGFLKARLNKIGRQAWGEKNKLARHADSGIPVDLFSIPRGSWYNYLVCRTGPEDSNKRIAVAAQAKGWKWKPYSPGFVRIDKELLDGEFVVVETDERHVVASERDVFEFVGLPYLEPWERAP